MELYSSTWSEVPDDNDLPPPSGFKTGEDTGDVKLTFREIMAAFKRNWNLSQPTCTLVSATHNLHTIYQSDGVTVKSVSGYAAGQIFALKVPTGDSFNFYPDALPTLGASGLAQKKVYRPTWAGLEQPVAQYLDIRSEQVGFFYYDPALDSGNGGFVLFAGAYPLRAPEEITCILTTEAAAVSAGTGKFTFRMPYFMYLTGVSASLTTAQTSGNILTVDINSSFPITGSILSTKLTIDNGEKTSATAVTPAVLLPTSANGWPVGTFVSDDSEITIDVDQIGDGTAKGLKVTLVGYQA